MGQRIAASNGTGNIALGLIGGLSLLIFLGMARSINNDRGKDPLYSWVIGKEYKTLSDQVIYKHPDSKDLLLKSYGRGVPNKNEMKDKFPFNYKEYHVVIYGVLPAGTVFKVSRVAEEGSTNVSFIYYFANVISSDNSEWIGKEVSPIYLTDLGNPPKFDPKLVEEVTPTEK